MTDVPQQNERPRTSTTQEPANVLALSLRCLTIGLLVSVGIVAFDGLGVTITGFVVFIAD